MNYGTTKGGKTLSFKIHGMEKLMSALKDIPIEATTATQEKMLVVCLDLSQKSIELAPLGVDYKNHTAGELKRSGFAEVESKGKKITGRVGFGKNGSEADKYSLRQHEELSFNHPRGGQAKFLEEPFKENIQNYIAAIGRAIKRQVSK